MAMGNPMAAGQGGVPQGMQQQIGQMPGQAFGGMPPQLIQSLLSQGGGGFNAPGRAPTPEEIGAAGRIPTRDQVLAMTGAPQMQQGGMNPMQNAQAMRARLQPQLPALPPEFVQQMQARAPQALPAQPPPGMEGQGGAIPGLGGLQGMMPNQQQMQGMNPNIIAVLGRLLGGQGGF